MSYSALLFTGTAFHLGANCQSLEDVCSIAYFQASLPSQGLYLANGMKIAINVDLVSVFAQPINNVPGKRHVPGY